jgi:hypothetical protein
MRVGRWASRVEKGDEGQAEIEEGLGSYLNGISVGSQVGFGPIRFSKISK